MENNIKTFFGNVKSSLNSEKSKNGMKFANSALNLTSNLIPTQESKGKNPTGYEAQQAIGDALTKFPNPIVKGIGVAFNAASQIGELTDTNISMMTKDQAQNWGIKPIDRFANNVIGTLAPTAGWLFNKVEDGRKSHLIDEMSNAYADTVTDINQADIMGGGRYLSGGREISSKIRQANRSNSLLTDMNITNTMYKNSDYGGDIARQNMNRYAGTNYLNMTFGRKGMKIQSLEEIREMIKNRVTENEDVQKFAEGGSLLPTGKLHKELNHLNELGEQFEDLTRKGIPVITVDESGDMVQVAEIEHSEIILSKEITDQIESYWKDGSEEAMISAGKLLAEEILYNMKDDGGVLDGNNEGKN